MNFPNLEYCLLFIFNRMKMKRISAAWAVHTAASPVARAQQAWLASKRPTHARVRKARPGAVTAPTAHAVAQLAGGDRAPEPNQESSWGNSMIWATCSPKNTAETLTERAGQR